MKIGSNWKVVGQRMSSMRSSIALLGRYKRIGGVVLESGGRRAASGGPAAPHGPLIPFPPGPRQFQQLKNWFGSAGVFGATAFGLLCYFSDWKVVVAYIPFYNTKFTEEDLEVKK